jgi:DsbC/DsbD-like thiol-disulfide interchange protein
MRRLILLAATLLSTTAPVLAGATAWQEVAPDVRLRLVSSDVLSAEGTTMAALEVDMPEGSKTYWRVPGESGIPTEINISGSSGISDGRILWPFPQIDDSAGVTDFVYYGPTVLPLDLKVDGTSANLAASVTMGICSDVCMPVKASFSLPLGFSKPDHSEGLRIAQAVARVPIPWDGDADAIGAVDFDAATGTLSVEVASPSVQPESLLVDTGIADAFFGAPQKRPDGRLVTLPLLGQGSSAELAGRKVELSFMTDEGPYVVSRTIAAAGSTPPDR